MTALRSSSENQTLFFLISTVQYSGTVATVQGPCIYDYMIPRYQEYIVDDDILCVVFFFEEKNTVQ